MFKTINLKVLTAVALLFSFCSVQFAMSKDKLGTLTVNISGMSNDKGLVRIALFDSKEAFSDNKYRIGGAVRIASLKILKKKSSWVVKDLPFGEYAVRTFHDVDETGKFKVNRLGIPKYEYGFSNDAKAMFGPPSYESSKFKFKADKTIEIKMHR